jgi:hypothetical protein
MLVLVHAPANSLIYKRFGSQLPFRLNWLRFVKLPFMNQTFGRFTFGRIIPHADPTANPILVLLDIRHFGCCLPLEEDIVSKGERRRVLTAAS